MDSIEKMAGRMLKLYMKPLVLNGKKVMDGWPAHIAAKKAAAANPGFKKEIYAIAEKLKSK